MWPLLELFNSGVDGLHVTKPVSHGVDPMRAAVHGHPASAELPIDSPMPGRNVRRILPAVLCGQPQPGFAQETAPVEGPVNGALADTSPALLGIGCDEAGLLCSGDDFLCRPDGDADRLFAKNVNASVQEFAP